MGQCANKHVQTEVVDRSVEANNSKSKQKENERHHDNSKKSKNTKHRSNSVSFSPLERVTKNENNCKLNSKSKFNENRSQSYVTSDDSDDGDENDISWRTHESRWDKNSNCNAAINNRKVSTSSFGELCNRSKESHNNDNNNGNKNKKKNKSVSGKATSRQRSTSAESLSRSQSLIAMFDSSTNNKSSKRSQFDVMRLLSSSPGVIEINSLLPQSVIAKTGPEVRGQQVYIGNLQKCGIYLLEVCKDVHIQHCQSCFIFIGPTIGQVDIERCTDCIFVIVTHSVQLRCCEQCILSLHVQQLPVLVECHHISLSPFTSWYSYPEMEVHLRKAHISPFVNCYSTVKEIGDGLGMLTSMQSILVESIMDESLKTMDRSESLRETKETTKCTSALVCTPFLTSTLLSLAESNVNSSLQTNNRTNSNESYQYLDCWALDVALANVVFKPTILSKLEEELHQEEEKNRPVENDPEEYEYEEESEVGHHHHHHHHHDNENIINACQNKVITNDKEKCVFAPNSLFPQSNKLHDNNVLLENEKSGIVSVKFNGHNNNYINENDHSTETTRRDEMDSEVPLPSTQSTQIHHTNASVSPSVVTGTGTGSANNTATAVHLTTQSSTTQNTTTNTTSSNTNFNSTVLARSNTLPASDMCSSSSNKKHNEEPTVHTVNPEIMSNEPKSILLDCSSIDKQRQYEDVDCELSSKTHVCTTTTKENMKKGYHERIVEESESEEEELHDVYQDEFESNNVNSVLADSNVAMESAHSAEYYSKISSTQTGKSDLTQNKTSSNDAVQEKIGLEHVSRTRKYRSSRQTKNDLPSSSSPPSSSSTSLSPKLANKRNRAASHTYAIQETEELVYLHQLVEVVRTLVNVCTPPDAKWWETMWARADGISRHQTDSSYLEKANDNKETKHVIIAEQHNKGEDEQRNSMFNEMHLPSLQTSKRVFVPPIECFATQVVLPFTFGANLIPPRFFFEGWTLRLVIFVKKTKQEMNKEFKKTSVSSSSSLSSSALLQQASSTFSEAPPTSQKEKSTGKHASNKSVNKNATNTKQHESIVHNNGETKIINNSNKNVCEMKESACLELMCSIELQRRCQLMKFAEQFIQSISSSKSTFNCKTNAFSNNSHQWSNTSLTKRCGGVLLLNTSYYTCTSSILQEYVAPTFYQVLINAQKEKERMRAVQLNKQNDHHRINCLASHTNVEKNNLSEQKCKIIAPPESLSHLDTPPSVAKSSWSLKQLLPFKWNKNKQSKEQSKPNVAMAMTTEPSATASENTNTHSRQDSSSMNKVECAEHTTTSPVIGKESTQGAPFVATPESISCENVRRSLAFALTHMANHKCVLLLSLVAPTSSPLASEVTKTFAPVNTEHKLYEENNNNSSNSTAMEKSSIASNTSTRTKNVNSENCKLVLDLCIPLHLVSMMQKNLFFKSQMCSEYKSASLK